MVDFGGVLTTSLGDAFRSFCEREGVAYERVRTALREAYDETDPESVVVRFETGRMEREEFEREMAAALSDGLERPVEPAGLIGRMGADLLPDEGMIAAVRGARGAGVRTALLSNSWGTDLYPHDLLKELFDEVVISGQVGLRKPDPAVFRLAAQRLALSPRACVFVDDVRSNVEAAEAVGMLGVVHQAADATIAELERLLRVPLSDPDAAGTI